MKMIKTILAAFVACLSLVFTIAPVHAEDYDVTSVHMYVYNEETGKYDLMEPTDGKYVLTVGKSYGFDVIYSPLMTDEDWSKVCDQWTYCNALGGTFKGGAVPEHVDEEGNPIDFDFFGDFKAVSATDDFTLEVVPDTAYVSFTFNTSSEPEATATPETTATPEATATPETNTTGSSTSDKVSPPTSTETSSTLNYFPVLVVAAVAGMTFVLKKRIAK